MGDRKETIRRPDFPPGDCALVTACRICLIISSKGARRTSCGTHPAASQRIAGGSRKDSSTEGIWRSQPFSHAPAPKMLSGDSKAWDHTAVFPSHSCKGPCALNAKAGKVGGPGKLRLWGRADGVSLVRDRRGPATMGAEERGGGENGRLASGGGGGGRAAGWRAARAPPRA